MATPPSQAETPSTTASRAEKPTPQVLLPLRGVSRPGRIPPIRTHRLGYALVSGIGAATPDFQLLVTMDGATTTLDANANSTENSIKAGVAAKTGRPVGDCFVLLPGGKVMNDGDVSTLGQHGVGAGQQVELIRRRRGGMDEAAIKAAFNMYDGNNDGRISREELKYALNRRLASFGRAGRMTAEELEQLVAQYAGISTI